MLSWIFISFDDMDSSFPPPKFILVMRQKKKKPRLDDTIA